MSKAMLRVFATIAWAAIIIVAGEVYYLNHYTPRGPMYDTGDVVCQNDDRGPCGEQWKEDMSHLKLTDWEKFLKDDTSLLIILPLLVLAVFVTDKAIKTPS